MRKCCVMAIVVFIVVSCGCANRARLSLNPDIEGGVKFWVGDSRTDKMLEGIELKLVADDGTIETMGLTDVFGSISVSREDLARAKVLLFCHEHFFCGAIQVDSPEFSRRNERLIQLAPIAFM